VPSVTPSSSASVPPDSPPPLNGGEPIQSPPAPTSAVVVCGANHPRTGSVASALPAIRAALGDHRTANRCDASPDVGRSKASHSAARRPPPVRVPAPTAGSSEPAPRRDRDRPIRDETAAGRWDMTIRAG
jgi:hypothetical protein